MRKIFAIFLSLMFLQSVEPATANAAINCTQPTRESERLLCEANQIRARRVQTVVAGALMGAILGNLIAKQNGTNTDQAMINGAIAGGLTGYWLNLQNEIAAKAASQQARASELRVQVNAEVRRQRTSATNLHAELKQVMLRSSDDPKRRQEELAQIAQAANLGIQQAQDSGQGYTKVGEGLGTPVNGDGYFASTATDFNRTRTEACSKLTSPSNFGG